MSCNKAALISVKASRAIFVVFYGKSAKKQPAQQQGPQEGGLNNGGLRGRFAEKSCRKSNKNRARIAFEPMNLSKEGFSDGGLRGSFARPARAHRPTRPTIPYHRGGWGHANPGSHMFRVPEDHIPYPQVGGYGTWDLEHI